MLRITGMLSDVRQTIWRLREQSLPRIFGYLISELRIHLCEIREQLHACFGDALPRTLHRMMHGVFAAKQQAPIISPPQVVIRTRGVPRHHEIVGPLSQSARRENVGVL